MTTKIDKLPIKVLGTLADFGLGTPGKIGKDIDPLELENNIEKVTNCIAEKTDITCLACIDGRKILKSSMAPGIDINIGIRGSLTGGGLAVPVAALLSNSLLFQKVEQSMQGASMEVMFHAMEEELVKSGVGYVSSSHTGGCAAANSLVAHTQQLSNNVAIANTTAVLAKELYSKVDTPFSATGDINISRLVINAGVLAQNLEISRWNGAKYTENTRGSGVVDELEHDKSEFSGHKEQMIVIKFGDRNRTVDRSQLAEQYGMEVFLVDLDDASYYAGKMQNADGESNFDRAFGAFIAHGLAAANGITDPKMPVILLDLTQAA